MIVIGLIGADIYIDSFVKQKVKSWKINKETTFGLRHLDKHIKTEDQSSVTVYFWCSMRRNFIYYLEFINNYIHFTFNRLCHIHLYNKISIHVTKQFLSFRDMNILIHNKSCPDFIRYCKVNEIDRSQILSYLQKLFNNHGDGINRV